MCFDEATSALDTTTEREIQKAIDEVSKGATTLMIAHRLSTVRNCDIIIVLKHGAIVEQGSHDQLLQIPNGHYRELWEKQSEQTQREIEERMRKQQEEEEYKKTMCQRLELIKKKSEGKVPLNNINNTVPVSAQIEIVDDDLVEQTEEEKQQLVKNQNRTTEVLDEEDTD